MMDITTGVFTAITSGHYIITYSASADLVPGKSIYISIYHNGNPVREGSWWSFLGAEGGISHMVDQGSRTVVSCFSDKTIVKAVLSHILNFLPRFSAWKLVTLLT